MIFDYYYGEQSESIRFLRVSRLLFTAPQFRGLSTDAKLRYSLMLDRMCLSARNDWYDGQGRIFIHYTVTDITEYLNCKKDKVLKLLNVMDNKKGVGLIERVRQGQGKPSKIYVRQFTSQGCPDPPHHSIGSRSQDCTEAEVLTAQNNTAASRKTGSQEYGKTECNYTDKNYTESNDTDPSIYPAARPTEDKPPAAADRIDTIRIYREILKENIEYDHLCERVGYDRDMLDEMLEILVDTVCSTRKQIRIGGQDYPNEVVKSRFLKLDSSHIEYVLDSLHQNTTKVRNIRAYLLTALYNAPTTISSYYTALVNHDLYGSG